MSSERRSQVFWSVMLAQRKLKLDYWSYFVLHSIIVFVSIGTLRAGQNVSTYRTTFVIINVWVNREKDSCWKLVNEILFHHSSELIISCLSKHVLSIRYQLFFAPFFSDTVPVWSCSYLHSIKTAPLLFWLKISMQSTCQPYGHFSYAVPSVWNSLPREIEHIS